MLLESNLHSWTLYEMCKPLCKAPRQLLEPNCSITHLIPNHWSKHRFGKDLYLFSTVSRTSDHDPALLFHLGLLTVTLHPKSSAFPLPRSQTITTEPALTIANDTDHPLTHHWRVYALCFMLCSVLSVGCFCLKSVNLCLVWLWKQITLRGQ